LDFGLSSLVYDGFEFKEKDTLARYVSLKRRVSLFTLISIATLGPALVFFLESYISPKTSTPYLYLVFIAISIPFTVLSFQANSKLTELVNSNDVRHVGF